MNTPYLAIALSALLLMSACSRHSELHDAMEDMGGAFKVMRDSQDIEQIQQKLVELKAGLEISAAQMVSAEDQVTFGEGLDKVKTLVVQVEAALAQGDLPAAKAAIDELGSVRKRYHEKLGVK